VAGKEKRATAQRKDEVMKIGSFKFDERASDIIGKIATREMRFPYLIMRRVEDRQSDSAPSMRFTRRTARATKSRSA
jgi:hypothetical protein